MTSSFGHETLRMADRLLFITWTSYKEHTNTSRSVITSIQFYIHLLQYGEM